MARITDIAQQFFDALESGKGWEMCQIYCTPDASFATQSERMGNFSTLRDYATACARFLQICPNAHYIVKSFATDEERNNVCAYAVITATHSEEGGPCPPTGKTTTTDYVYCMDFVDDKIRHMTKIWNPGWAMKELGWT